MKFSPIFLAIYAFAYVVLSGMPELTNIEDILGVVLIIFFVLEYTITKGYKIPWHWSINLVLAFYSLVLFSLLLQPQTIRLFITFTLVLILFYAVFSIIGSNSEGLKVVTYGFVLGIIYLVIFNYDQIYNISEGLSNDRFAGSMNANNFSFLLVIVITFLVKPFFLKKKLGRYNLLLRIILIILFSYLVIGVIGSRRGIVVLFIILVWMYFYLFKNTRVIQKISLTTIFVLITFFAVIWLQESVLYYRFEIMLQRLSGEQVASNSITLRTQMITKGWDLWQQKLLLGWGFGAFKYESGFGQYSHNNYIELLVNHGLIGFLLYYSFIGALFYKAYKKYKNAISLSVKGIMSWVMLLIFILLVGDIAVVSLPQKTNWIVLGVALATIVNSKKNK